MNSRHIFKTVATLLLMLAPFIGADATPLTPQEALSRVANSPSMKLLPGVESYELSYSAQAGGKDLVYVFNRGDKGFIVVSGDTRMPALLGYSEGGAYDTAKSSPELKWWLGQYAEEALAYLENAEEPDVAYVARQQRESRVNIPEMLETRWDQREPYNLACPVDGGGRCVTGCVATAMAQVIKYHNYPSSGTGMHQYDWRGNTLSFDYGANRFDYADMLPQYSGGESEEQMLSVATLMYACGVGVNMDYSSRESGAVDFYIPYALKTFFNYDAGVRLLDRIYYSTDEWEDMVYTELSEGRPVIYSGHTAGGGGHEFVCDGYEEGYFHINWGWNGDGNGYFLLSALDPGLQGVGGFAGGYNSDQSIVCGIQPAVAGSQSQPWYQIYAKGNLLADEVYGNYGVFILMDGGGVYNYYPEEADVTMFLKVVSESGAEYMAEDGTELHFNAAEGGSAPGYGGFTLYIPTDLTAGTYKASIVFRTPDGNLQELLFPKSQVAYLDMTVDNNGNVTFTSGMPEIMPKLRVTGFAPNSAVLPGVSTRFNVVIENVGEVEYTGAFYVKTFEKGTNEQLANQGVRLSIAPGEVFDGYFNMTYYLAEGEYDVICYDMYNEPVSDVFPLWIGEKPVEVEAIILSQTEASIEVGGTLQLSATVEPDDAVDKHVVWSSSNPEIANVDQDGLVTAFNVGEVDIIATSSAVEHISGMCRLTVTPKIVEVEAITLDKTEATLVEGESFILIATIEPEDATDRTVEWSTSDASVATVEDGIVTAVAPGTAIIIAQATNGIEAACTVDVIAKGPEVVYATYIELDITSIEAEVDSVVQLKATVLPEYATDKRVEWRSSDEAVAVVDEDGVVTIVGIGTAVITATTTDGTDLSADCSVTGLSGINEVLKDAGKVDIYSLGGFLLMKEADVEYISKLSKGVYIVIIDGKALKIVK